MARHYDKIKTVRELINDVRAHGFSTAVEDICRVQDIFGHSSIEELAGVANENSQEFYMVLFKIWRWDEATAFYNEHSNPVNINSLKKELSDCKEQLEASKKQISEFGKGYSKELENNAKLGKALDEYEKENQDLKDEIIKLKAKLYDIMVKKEVN